MRSLILALSLSLALIGCSDTADGPQPTAATTSTTVTSTTTVSENSGSTTSVGGGDSTTTTSPRSATTSSTSLPDDAEPTPLAEISLRRTLIADGFTQPVGVFSRTGSDSIYIADQDGEVWILPRGEQPILWLDIRSDVTFGGEQGLLGVAFHPTEPEVYVAYSNRSGATTVDRWMLDTTGSPAERSDVISVDQPLRNHNGGNIAFGPDGYLWLGLGDGGGANDTLENGQNPDTLLGSMLRLDVSASPYAVPADNPFVSGGGAPEAYLIGLRNPWRFSFDGDDVWIADVGQGEWEEVNVLPVGAAHANLGWPILEGTHCFTDSDCTAEGTVLPVYEYRHEGGRCSITGGFVYRGEAIPELDGAYVFGDYCSGEVVGIRVDGEGLYDERVWPELQSPQLTSFGVDSLGELYLTTATGEVWRIER